MCKRQRRGVDHNRIVGDQFPLSISIDCTFGDHYNHAGFNFTVFVAVAGSSPGAVGARAQGGYIV